MRNKLASQPQAVRVSVKIQQEQNSPARRQAWRRLWRQLLVEAKRGG